MNFRYQDLTNLDSLRYPWIIVSEKNNGKIRGPASDFEPQDAFFEVWFSGIKGGADFISNPVFYYVETKKKGGFTVIEDSPLLSYIGYPAHSFGEARGIAKREAGKLVESIMGEVLRKKKINKVFLYTHSGSLKAEELVKNIGWNLAFRLTNQIMRH